MANTWILVAESSRARLYAADNRRSDITELEDMAHPEGRLHAGDLVSDTAGSDGGSIGQGRHVLDERSDLKQTAAAGFAKRLANRLEAARHAGAFRRLVLIAPPAFLGLLRDKLSKEVLALVARQVDKNLVQQQPEAVRPYL